MLPLLSFGYNTQVTFIAASMNVTRLLRRIKKRFSNFNSASFWLSLGGIWFLSTYSFSFSFPIVLLPSCQRNVWVLHQRYFHLVIVSVLKGGRVQEEAWFRNESSLVGNPDLSEENSHFLKNYITWGLLQDDFISPWLFYFVDYSRSILYPLSSMKYSLHEIRVFIFSSFLRKLPE